MVSVQNRWENQDKPKKVYCKPPPPNKDKNKNRKTQKARAPPWKFSLFGENQEVESEEVQEEKLC